MSSVREAAEKLLAALDQWREKGGPVWQCDPAIEGPRTALAQQAEPVAWMLTVADDPRVRFLEWQEETRGYTGAWIKTPLYTAPPQQAESVEPVAWRYVPSEVWGDRVVTQDPKTVELARQYGRPIEPLYTAPPQQAEPVGVVSSMVKGGVIWHRWPDQMPDGTKLHAAPAHRDEPDDGNPSFG